LYALSPSLLDGESGENKSVGISVTAKAITMIVVISTMANLIIYLLVCVASINWGALSVNAVGNKKGATGIE
jgi:hypothetical protein